MNEFPTSQPASAEREAALAALALARPAAERGKWLDAVCAGDQNLRQRLESLIAAQQSAAEPADSPAEADSANLMLDLADFWPDQGVAQTQGRYKLLEQIGEGGCGVVYVAEQTEPVRRQVAVKVIKLGMDTRQVIARFEAERQALAMMDHPDIARVFDGGSTPAGRPYFVMEYVDGVPITKFCDTHRLP